MKKKCYSYYRSMRTHSEQVANEEICEDGMRIKWGRARRNSSVLDPWNNEKQPITQKSWKCKRQNQYNVGKRGKNHTLYIAEHIWNRWSTVWKFECYCKDHNIPYLVKTLAHNEVHWQYQRTWQFIGYETSKQLKRIVTGEYKKKAEWVWIPYQKPVYDWVYDYNAPLIKRTYSVYDGTELIWWSDKDIGIEYILKKAAY